jgi:hypothetical protein
VFRDDTATSSVLAVVLMMGFVAAVAVSLFVVGTATLDQTTEDAQDRQVENTFRQLNKQVSGVAFGRQKYRTMDFDIEDNRAAFHKANTGQIKVFVDGTLEANKSVGSLVYESKRSTISYQAGGIWRDTGKDSRMVAKPPVDYENGSLSFPIPVLTGDENVRAGNLDINKQRTIAPLNDDGYIEGKLVKLEITSEYYMGWAEYFHTQTNDVAVSVDHSPAGPKGTVTVKLGKPIANGDFRDGVVTTGGDDGDVYFDGGSAIIDGDVTATGTIDDSDGTITGTKTENNDSGLYELDTAIDRKIEDAETNGSVTNVSLSTGGSLAGGNWYYAEDGFTLDNGEDLDVDLSSGNVTLIVDGNISLEKGDIDVDPHGTDNALRIYSTGDFGMKNSEAGANWSEGASHFQIYGTSSMEVALQGGTQTQFVGTIYAPRDEPELMPGELNGADIVQNGKCDGWDACITTGSGNVLGSIVAGPMKLGQDAGLTYDADLKDVDPTLQLEDGVLPPPITFIKVSVHEISVNNSDSRNLAPAGGFQSVASVTATGDALDSRTAAGPGSDLVTAPKATRVVPTLD